MKHEPYKSYLVRFWWEDKRGESKGGWRGEVESVQTGQKRQFDDLEAMGHFFQERMEGTGRTLKTANSDKGG